MTQLSECLFEEAEPRLAVIETQLVESASPAKKGPAIPVHGPHGFGVLNNMLRRKRVALVDAAKPPGELRGNGIWLTVPVVPFNGQERGRLATLMNGEKSWPNPGKAVLDRAFAADRCEA